jgi:hypothetical protein
MSHFLRDILLGLTILGCFMSFWSCLCASAVVSLCSETLRSKFWFSVSPFMISTLAIFSKLPVRINEQNLNVNFDLAWIFLIPSLLSFISLFYWYQAKSENNL